MPKREDLFDINQAFLKMLGLEDKIVTKVTLTMEAGQYPILKATQEFLNEPKAPEFIGYDGFQLVPIPLGYDSLLEDDEVAIVRTYILRQAIQALERDVKNRNANKHIVDTFKRAIELRYPKKQVDNGTPG